MDLRTTENKYFGTGNLSEADADEIESNLDEIHKLAQELNIKIDNMPDTVSQAGPSNNNILDNLSSKSSNTRVSERSEIPIPVRASSRRTAPSVVSAYTTSTSTSTSTNNHILYLPFLLIYLEIHQHQIIDINIKPVML